MSDKEIGWVDLGLDSSEVSEALDLCSQILRLLEDIPEAGEDFAASVEEKTLSIQEWIEEHDHVTAAQQEALENMLAGAERWIR